MIEKGSKWRIGNGYRVDIWEHKWINKPPFFRPERRDELQGMQVKVAALIDYEVRHWNVSTMKEWFSPEDARLILQIPLCRRDVEDKLIWRTDFFRPVYCQICLCCLKKRFGEGGDAGITYISLVESGMAS